MTLNYPKDKFYKNQPLTFRNASGNGDKFQILKSKIYRVLKATTDEEDIKKLQESLIFFCLLFSGYFELF